MAFKADTSFLRFLTMGAVGVQATIEYLQTKGFQPIELERYCTSNKIWATKVKRLRLPDLLCVKTGVRVEVRAKSSLKIRMSDAPDNEDRRWHSGLRHEDLIAFIACRPDGQGMLQSGEPIFFETTDLLLSEANSRLGPPKSASEGAERDREWPCTVPSQDGVVEVVSADRIRTKLDTGRTQTYLLRGKNRYVSIGDRFLGGGSIIAGIVPKVFNIEAGKVRTWDPSEMLTAEKVIDRYSAAKALPYWDGPRNRTIGLLEDQLDLEDDLRVKLEIAGSLARMDSERGYAFIKGVIVEDDSNDMRMEGVLILSEIGSNDAVAVLDGIVRSEEFKGSEIRHAAVWGLGKAGAGAYDLIKSLIHDDEREVALHAIAGFGPDTPPDIIRELVRMLFDADKNKSAAASEVLHLIGTEEVLAALLEAREEKDCDLGWVIATLGRLSPVKVREVLAGDPLLDRVNPLLLLSEEDNWLAGGNVRTDLEFLLGQSVN